jgi:hypothetical protein
MNRRTQVKQHLDNLEVIDKDLDKALKAIEKLTMNETVGEIQTSLTNALSIIRLMQRDFGLEMIDLGRSPGNGPNATAEAVAKVTNETLKR